MTALDLIVLGILVISSVLGAMRGLIKEAVSLAAWVLAFLGAKHFAPMLAPWLPGIETPALRHAAALVLVFVAILLLASVAGAVLASLAHLAGLAPHDRTAGALFGFLRGCLAVVGLALLAGLTALPQTRAWHDALFRAPLELAAGKLKPWLPNDLAALIRY